MEATNHIEKTSQHTIPEGWREFFLGELGEVKMCKRVMKHQTLASGEIPFYKIGTFGGTPDAYISRDLFTDFRSRFSYPKKGDILLSAAGTIGRTVVFDGEDSYFQDSNIVWIDNKEDKVLNSLLYYYYKVMKFHTENGGIVVRLYNENLRNTTFCAPESLEEQKRIANALSSVDNMIGALDEAIAKKRQIKEGLIQQLLTGKTRLPGFTGEWDEVSFKSIYKYAKEGGTPSTGVAEYYNPATVPFAKIEDLKDKYLTRVESYLSESGVEHSSAWVIPVDSVILSNGATLGEVSINKIPTSTKQGILGIILKEQYSPEFVYYLFKGREFRREMERVTTHGTMDCAYLKDLNAIPLTIPSLEEQEAIASVISSFDKEVYSLESLRNKYSLIKQGMMQELLTGKTRLK